MKLADRPEPPLTEVGYLGYVKEPSNVEIGATDRGAERRPYVHQRAALETLYHLHWKELVYYARRAFGEGPPDPEDAAQQAFAQYASLDNPGRIGEPRAYLYRSVSNFIISYRRRQQTSTRFASSTEAQFLFGGAEEISAERVLSAKDRARILERAIAGLKPRHREALVRNRIQGMTYAETASALGVSETEARRLVMVALSHCDRALVAANEDVSDLVSQKKRGTK